MLRKFYHEMDRSEREEYIRGLLKRYVIFREEIRKQNEEQFIVDVLEFLDGSQPGENALRRNAPRKSCSII